MRYRIALLLLIVGCQSYPDPYPDPQDVVACAQYANTAYENKMLGGTTYKAMTANIERCCREYPRALLPCEELGVAP